MSTIINFKIEKLLTQERKFSGYFVTAVEGDVASNPLAGMMKMFGEGMGGEHWKDKVKPEQRFFFATEKEASDYIAYQLGEFKDKS